MGTSEKEDRKNPEKETRGWIWKRRARYFLRKRGVAELRSHLEVAKIYKKHNFVLAISFGSFKKPPLLVFWGFQDDVFFALVYDLFNLTVQARFAQHSSRQHILE